MPHQYSKTTGFFYDTALSYPSIPQDAVAVSDADYAALFMAQSRGAAITASATGSPQAVSAGGAGAVIDLSTVTDTSDYTTPVNPLVTLANIRYAREYAGVWFKAAGAAIASLYGTDDTSQSKLLTAFVSATGGLWADGSVWKTSDGAFVSLTAADVSALAKKAQAYVQACFANEAALAAALQADSKTDLSVGWPNNGLSTAYALSGPATAVVGVAVTLSLTPDQTGPEADVVVTLSDGGAGGVFSPPTLTLAAHSLAAPSATYTPKAAGAVTISTTNDGGLSNPAALSVSVAPAGTTG